MVVMVAWVGPCRVVRGSGTHVLVSDPATGRLLWVSWTGHAWVPAAVFGMIGDVRTRRYWR
jgi:hypothetical protein